MPNIKTFLDENDEEAIKSAYWEKEIEFQPVFNLGNNMLESMEKMEQSEEILKKFPGLDCGSCGAPTCRALAEDVVRGVASERYCFDVLRKLYKEVTNDDKSADREK